MNAWVEAARPKTLVAAVAPVLVGTAAADRFLGERFVLTLVVAVALQVAVTYANALSDPPRGVDAQRRGPRRAVSSGLISPSLMKLGIACALGVASVAGLVLVLQVGLELAVLGGACPVATPPHPGGPRPYASEGLGEVFVFVFFGLVATAGSAYVQEEHVSMVALAAAVPVGLLASAILVVNNLRAIDSDAAAGKRTLAVRIGDRTTRSLYRRLVLAAFALLPVVAGVAMSIGPLVAFVTLPLGLQALRLGEDALVQSARLELVFAILLAAGLGLPT
ncbi:MAG: 1,4-dihydroxy-2-naphthoate octaprenyltransferase [Actinomycetota bacterium]